MLDDLGLNSALNWLIREFNNYYDKVSLEVSLDFEESKVNDRTKIVVFRVLQEALNNVAKHSGASRVQVQFYGHEDGLKLQVQDDGCGFSLTDVDIQEGIGLASMRERLELVDAELVIESSPSGGTKITAHIPQ